MSESNEANQDVRLCYTCGERPAYPRSSYCGRCHSIRVEGYKKARVEKKIHLNVDLTKVGIFGQDILKMLPDLENATETAVRRFLQTQLEITVKNLVSISTSLIDAQLK